MSLERSNREMFRILEVEKKYVRVGKEGLREIKDEGGMGVWLDKKSFLVQWVGLWDEVGDKDYAHEEAKDIIDFYGDTEYKIVKGDELHIKTNKKTPPHAFHADEISFVEDGILRLWWD